MLRRIAGRMTNRMPTTSTVAPIITDAIATADPSGRSPVIGAVAAPMPNWVAPMSAAALPAR